MNKILDPEEDVITIRELERRLFVSAISRHKGNRNMAAAEIGITADRFLQWEADYKSTSKCSIINPEEDVITVRELERRVLVAALTKHKGHQVNAATEMGISQRNLIRWVAEFGLNLKDFKPKQEKKGRTWL